MDAIKLLKNLIQIDTTNPPGNEKKAASYIDDILKKYGFNTIIQDIGNNRANIIAWIGNDDGPELMFNGHLDVVPALGEWSSDPFEPIEKNGLLYGRGSCDMKGGVAAMISAAIKIRKRMISEDKKMRGKLKLLFVADEEDASRGLHAYQDSFSPGQYCLIGEPTELQVAAAHRGVSRDYVFLHGQPRHAALKTVNEDAIAKTARFIKCIDKINSELSEYRHPLLPAQSIAITSLKGYEKDNIVPETVETLLDFRIYPKTSHEEVLRILQTGLNTIFTEKDYEIKPYFFMPGGEIDINDPFVSICLESANKYLSQKQGKAVSFNATCEQCFFSNQGVKTIILGPGSLKQAHGNDEFAPISEVEKAVNIYEKIALRILFTNEEVK